MADTRRHRLNQDRERIVEVQRGFYKCVDCDKEVIEVLTTTKLVRVERFGYEYPNLQMDLGWRLRGWRELTSAEKMQENEKERAAAVADAASEVRPEVRPKVRWWVRWWRLLFLKRRTRKHQTGLPRAIIHSDEAE